MLENALESSRAIKTKNSTQNDSSPENTKIFQNMQIKADLKRTLDMDLSPDDQVPQNHQKSEDQNQTDSFELVEFSAHEDFHDTWGFQDSGSEIVIEHVINLKVSGQSSNFESNVSESHPEVTAEENPHIFRKRTQEG